MADAPPKIDTRLKEVHQTDLTEGRINQDFVDWLKTKGMSYLLVGLLVLCAYLLYVRWNNSRQNYRAQAWHELATAALPTSLEEVAEKYDDVGAVATLARLNAAGELMRSVQTNKTLGADDAARSDLSPEQRTDYLERADRLYSEAIAADDQSPGKTLLIVTALNGRAVVAESRGEAEKARDFYQQAAKRAENGYADLAAKMRERADAVAALAADVLLPTNEEVNTQQSAPNAPGGGSVTVEPWIRALIDGTKDEPAPLPAPASDSPAVFPARSDIDPGG